MGPEDREFESHYPDKKTTRNGLFLITIHKYIDTKYWENLIKNHEKPKRKTMSSRFVLLKPAIILIRITSTKIKNKIKLDIARKKSLIYFENVIARHQSVLIRKLGNTDESLQKNKITNLKRACQDLNGVIINRGQVISLWETIGKPSHKKGYVNGMLLSNGQVIEGVGGGLCQLSNLLCWLFLHAEVEILERFHHSMDVFPDSGRTLPFGSGATCLYNFVDLKIKNTANYPIQLKIWVTENHLKGQILSPQQTNGLKFKIIEKNHCFIKKINKYYRYNEIWRIKKLNGQILEEVKIFTNLAPVLYKIKPHYLSDNNYKLFDLDSVK